MGRENFVLAVSSSQVTEEELDTRIASLRALEHMASGLRGQVTPPIAEKLSRLEEEARGKWEELRKGTEIRKEGQSMSSFREALPNGWLLIGGVG
jgi:hypothetical protein